MEYQQQLSYLLGNLTGFRKVKTKLLRYYRVNRLIRLLCSRLRCRWWLYLFLGYRFLFLFLFQLISYHLHQPALYWLHHLVFSIFFVKVVRDLDSVHSHLTVSFVLISQLGVLVESHFLSHRLKNEELVVCIKQAGVQVMFEDRLSCVPVEWLQFL